LSRTFSLCLDRRSPAFDDILGGGFTPNPPIS
jgi:hypothetical protein